MPQRDCDVCGRPYEYQRPSSKYCSDACRYRMFSAGSNRVRIPDNLRFAILRRDEFACRTCGFMPDEGAELRVDHLNPVANGGHLTDPANLITLCQRCNSGKGDLVIDPAEIPPARAPDWDVA